MIGVHVDQYVFAYVIQEKLPKIHKALERSQLQLPLITLQWFLCLFVNTLPTETALRVWDMFFNEGDKVRWIHFRVPTLLPQLPNHPTASNKCIDSTHEERLVKFGGAGVVSHSCWTLEDARGEAAGREVSS
jgi:hypothetical protein